MRSSIMTELLEVSHIKSIRQIFISILVLLVFQVALTDIFEKGTYVEIPEDICQIKNEIPCNLE